MPKLAFHILEGVGGAAEGGPESRHDAVLSGLIHCPVPEHCITVAHLQTTTCKYCTTNNDSTTKQQLKQNACNSQQQQHHAQSGDKVVPILQCNETAFSYSPSGT